MAAADSRLGGLRDAIDLNKAADQRLVRFACLPTQRRSAMRPRKAVLGSNWLISVFHSYAAELFPTRIRAQALGFTFCWGRLSAVFAGYWVAAMLARYGVIGVFSLIGGAMTIIVVSIGLIGPRTNGRGLEKLSP